MHTPVDSNGSGGSQNLEIIVFEGEITVIDMPKAIDLAVQELLNAPVLGFDTETKPSFKKGEKYSIALLQLSTDKKAYLFRLNKIGLPAPIVEILASPDIKKVGLAIRDDLRGLKELAQFEPKNFIEIQDIAKNKGLKSQGLQTITEEIFQKRLSKKAKLTNWEAMKLTDVQILYAATDAWIGLQIYNHLETI